MAGINRINITNAVRGRGAWRFVDAKKHHEAANELYRDAFQSLGMELVDGYELIDTDLDAHMAGYDAELGIDVWLEFANGSKSSMQEKFLFTTFRTVTVEYMQDPDEDIQGDWFNLQCEYYFVGYDRNKSLTFQEWILLDWSAVKRATAQGRIDWNERRNMNDGARASFWYVDFSEIPEDCIVASCFKPSARYDHSPQTEQRISAAEAKRQEELREALDALAKWNRASAK